MRPSKLAPFVPLGFLLCAAGAVSCDETGRCAEEIAVSFDTEVQVSALSKEEAVQLCEAIEAARLGTVSKEDYCLWKAVNVKALTLGASETCESDYRDCVAQSGPLEQEDCSADAASAAAADCHVTASEVIRCLNDHMEDRCDTYSGLSCDEVDEPSETDHIVLPDSCKGVVDKCPIADMGTGFRCRNN